MQNQRDRPLSPNRRLFGEPGSRPSALHVDVRKMSILLTSKLGVLKVMRRARLLFHKLRPLSGESQVWNMRKVRRIGDIAFTFRLGAALLAATGPTADASAPSSQVFRFAGKRVVQDYVVPPGVTVVDLQLFGGQGGAGGACGDICGAGGRGGLGAEVLTSLHVKPGETLTIVVGGAGKPGATSYSQTVAPGGGGGGGKTAVSVSGTPVAIAGGGGGGGGGGYYQILDAPPFPYAGGRGGNSGHNGTSSGLCAGSGGLAGPLAFGGSAGSGSGCQVGTAGGNGVGAVGGAGGVGGSDEIISVNPVQTVWLIGATGGSGGGGVLGGGGGGGGGAYLGTFGHYRRSRWRWRGWHQQPLQ